jgi:2-dehydropantoate 2-reductase
MKICIIGAGAMGGVHGGLLARVGHDVTLVDAWTDHVEAINRRGLEVRGIRGDHVVRLRASTGARGVGPVDAAIVFTDSNATAQAAQVAEQVLDPTGFALTLQNGIGNIEALTGVLGASRVAAGVSMNSAACTSPGVVAYTNAGITTLGELDGRLTERVRTLAAALNAAGIMTELVADPLAHVWSKFVLNCGINVLTAVSQLRSGEMFRVPEMNALQERVIDEILAVVERKGVRLADPDPRRTIREHCRVRFNKPSMLQHIEQGRRTEIDALNGALVREARVLGVPVPCNETLVAVIKGLERSRRQALHETPPDYACLEARAESEVWAEAAGEA